MNDKELSAVHDEVRNVSLSEIDEGSLNKLLPSYYGFGGRGTLAAKEAVHRELLRRDIKKLRSCIDRFNRQSTYLACAMIILAVVQVGIAIASFLYLK